MFRKLLDHTRFPALAACAALVVLASPAGAYNAVGAAPSPVSILGSADQDGSVVLARRGRGRDDGPGHDRRGRGRDDGPGDDRGGRGRGADDGPNHT
jgi:hypothetical protein